MAGATLLAMGNATKGKKRRGGFSGKKAAPFKRGGGRKAAHPNTGKGKPRKKR